MVDTNISFVRGNSFSFDFEYDGTTDDLDGAYFSCKSDENDEEYVFQKTLGDGITKFATGKYSVRVAPEDTAEIPVRNYYYDFTVVMGEDVETIFKGMLTLQSNITTIEGE